MPYSVILTLESMCDVADITDYIEMRFGQERAERFQSDIYSQIEDLSYMGEVGAKTYIFYCNYIVYKKLFPPSIIIYVLNKSKNEIHLLRILCEECNWKLVLKQNREYTYP